MSLDFTATARDAPDWAMFEQTWETNINLSAPPVAIAFNPIGVKAWCIPVITINGKVAPKIPTITKPNFVDKKLIATANQSPINPPTTIKAIGALISIISVGFNINLNIRGVILSTNFSIYDIIQTIKITGITE